MVQKNWCSTTWLQIWLSYTKAVALVEGYTTKHEDKHRNLMDALLTKLQTQQGLCTKLHTPRDVVSPELAAMQPVKGTPTCSQRFGQVGTEMGQGSRSDNSWLSKSDGKYVGREFRIKWHKYTLCTKFNYRRQSVALLEDKEIEHGDTSSRCTLRWLPWKVSGTWETRFRNSVSRKEMTSQSFQLRTRWRTSDSLWMWRP